MKKFILYITLLMMPVLCSAKKAFVIEKDRTFIVTGEQPSPSAILAAQEYLIEITPETITLMGQDENFDTDGGRDNNGITPSKDRTKINYSQSTGDPSATAELTLPSIYDAQGTCYAVYDFLENYLGIRFYGPDSLNIIVPKQKNLKLSPVRIMRAPVLKYRDGSYSFDWPMMKEQYFNATSENLQLSGSVVKSGQPTMLSLPIRTASCKRIRNGRNYSKAIIPNTSQQDVRVALTNVSSAIPTGHSSSKWPKMPATILTVNL